MSRIDLEDIKEKLRVEGRKSLRMPFLVGKVRRFLWPFIRSYHFLTLEWVRDQIGTDGAANGLVGHLAALGDRQRALRAEVLAVSRQNAELRSEVDDLRSEIRERNGGTESYSQIGEDKIVAYIFERLGIPLKDICYIDVGSAYPDGHNNTFYFYKNGARGCLVEADPTYFPSYTKKRPGDIAINAAIVPETLKNSSGKVTFYRTLDRGWSTVLQSRLSVAEKAGKTGVEIRKLTVPAMTINELINGLPFGKNVNLLSIDIEGVDCDVIEEIDYQKFRPEIIICENGFDVDVNIFTRPSEKLFEKTDTLCMLRLMSIRSLWIRINSNLLVINVVAGIVSSPIHRT